MAEWEDLPTGPWPQIILADPPWKYAVWTGQPSRTADSHYAVSPLAVLTRLPVRQRVPNDAALFLWVPSPMLPEGLDLMAAWGFNYKTIVFVWVKLTQDKRRTVIGMGHYSRPETEVCLLGTRGSVGTARSRSVRQVIFATRRGHSQKPLAQYPRIERMYPFGSYLELFARNPDPRPGWQYWGNEV